MNVSKTFQFRISILLLTTVVIFSALGLAEAKAEVQDFPQVETYEELLGAIRHVRAATEERIEKAVEAEKVREAWETGKLINSHVLRQKRADYDKQVVLRLAKDLETSDTELYYMLEFARTYPIFPLGGKLSWSHYRALLDLKDPEERREVAEQAEKEGWNRDQVRKEVRKRNDKTGETGKEPVVLSAKPGKPGTYRIVRAPAGTYAGERVVDLGFSNYYRPPRKLRFEDQDIVSSQKGKIKKMKGAAENDLFTYPAYVTKALDGDTFNAVIDLGFGFNSVQTLRLRGLDAPELPSKEGQEAKEFLEKELQKGPVLIRTVKSDKYDRYLADVFVKAAVFEKTSKSSEAVLDRSASSATRGEFIYVNQELVKRGFASVVNE